MCAQLSFHFTDALTYSSEAFVVHQGVMPIADTLVTLVSERRFAVLYVHGPAGVGKTHLGVYCAGLVRALGRSVQMVRGGEVAGLLHSRASRSPENQGEVVIIDDAKEWLETKGCEALFTALADRVLHEEGLLVLFSSCAVDELHTTPQVMSRLTAGLQLAIGVAEERHLDAVVRAMAKQRGLRLTPAKRSFILARVPRTIEALSGYFTKLQNISQGEAASTSMKVLAQAAERQP